MKLLSTLRNAALALLPMTLLVSVPEAKVVDGHDEVRPAIEQYNLDEGLALSGYDPVAYFPQGGGKPKKGKKNLTLEHGGVTYRFASEQNRKLFRSDPKAFEPAYGGWCAYGMAKGAKFEANPKSFVIENGRLHVFYKNLIKNTRTSWLEEGGDRLRPAADKSWKGFLAESDSDDER